MKDNAKVDEQQTTALEQKRQRTVELKRSHIDHKPIETELKDSEENFWAFAKNAPIGVYYSDLKGTFLYGNKKAEEIVGYKREELIGKNFLKLKLIGPKDIVKAARLLFLNGQGKNTGPDEFEITRKDGTKRIVEINTSVITLVGKQAVIGMVQDITERTQAEAALRESEEKYKALINGMNDTAWVIDFNEKFIDVNDAAVEVLGYSREELLAMGPRDIDSSLKVEEISSLIKEMPADKIQVFETTHITKDGKMIPVEIKSSLVTYQGRRAILSIARDITERKRAEAALQESEQRYRSLVDNIDHGINLIDAAYNIMMVNCAQQRHFNKPLSQSIGKKCYREFEKCDAVCPHCPAVQTIASGQSAWAEIEVTGNDQRRYSLRIQTFPIFGHDGTVTAFIEVVEDITDRKNMEKALRESDERFRNVVKTMKVGLGAIDDNGVLTYVNEYFAKMLGYTPEEMIGRSTLDFYYDDESRKAQEEIFTKRKTGMRDLTPYEVTWRHKDGHKVYQILSPTPQFDSDGRYTGSFAIHTDITERKLMEQELRESEARYKALYEDNPSMYFTVDSEGTVLSVNRLGAEQLGYNAVELVGQPVLNIFYDDDKDAVQQQLKTCLQHPRELFHWEFRKCRKDGSIVWVKEAARAVRRADGSLVVFIVCEDITERKKAETELRESEERHRTLFEHAGFAIILFDAETGKRLAFNEIAHESLGYTREEFQEFSAADITVHMNHEETLKHFRSVIEKGPDLYEMQLVAKNGEIRDMLISAVPLRMYGRDLIQMIRVDITDNKRADKELKVSFEKLRRSLDATVSALASAVELRDPYTAGHQKRVTDLACAIAEEMGLPEERIAGIRMAGLIHDIGKISVPAEILNKPGHLNDIEYSLFKNHPQVGHDVLQTVEFPWPVAQIVLQHHERIDGSGYPQGLSGNDIMLEARVVAVADIVEAMASHRPYRPARGAGDALEEISHNKGILYDPEVVDACLRVFYNKGFKFEKSAKVTTSPKIH
jgi:PAS domain S-box-containing protein/putative nucleotidyltransferase with HDIG domain